MGTDEPGLELRNGAWLRAGVEGAGLRCGPGESVGLIGPSGAGKSTIARLMAGLIRPDRGELVLDGQRLPWPRGRGFHRRVQYVHQSPALDPRWSLDETLMEARRAAGLHDGWHRAWAQVGLDPELARRRPERLSGGQRHRAGLARALAVEPDYLILDEPTSGQDPPQVRRLVEVVAGLGTVGRILVSHELSLVRALTQRLGMVDGGRVVEMGCTERLLRAPEHPATRAWVEAATRWESGEPRESTG